MTIFGVTTHCNHCNHCQGPYRHYILNALWILINLLCLVLTLYQVAHNNHSMRSSSYVFIGPKSDQCPALSLSHFCEVAEFKLPLFATIELNYWICQN